MGIQGFINRVRSKPTRVRERILLVSMAILAPVIIAIWVLTLTVGTPDRGGDGKFSQMGAFLQNTYTNISDTAKAQFSGGSSDFEATVNSDSQETE